MANVAHSGLLTTNLHVPGYQQASDPGAIGTGKLWVDTTNGSGRWLAKVRNATDAGWEALSIDPAAPPVLGATTPNTATFSELSVTKTGAAANLSVNGSAGQNRQLRLQTGGVNRWVVIANSTAESGSDAGSDFAIGRNADNGTFLGFALTITRSTGAAAFSGALTVGGNLTITGALDHNGSTVGLYGVTPAARATGYTAFSNLTPDRTCNADSTSTAELADILGTLIEDLKLTGIIGA